MMEPEEILAKIREFAKTARTPVHKTAYRPPTPWDFRPATVLCFDQTLTNCGWALLNTETPGEPEVMDCGVIRPPAMTKEKGFEVTFVKSVYIAREMRELLKSEGSEAEEVVAELPAVAGFRTESSLVAAVTLVQALDEMGQGMPTFVPRQRAAAVLCGDWSAPKAVSNRTVDSLISDRHPSTTPWNEHIRDAVFIGLMHLYKGTS